MSSTSSVMVCRSTSCEDSIPHRKRNVRPSSSDFQGILRWWSGGVLRCPGSWSRRCRAFRTPRNPACRTACSPSGWCCPTASPSSGCSPGTCTSRCRCRRQRRATSSASHDSRKEPPEEHLRQLAVVDDNALSIVICAAAGWSVPMSSGKATTSFMS